MVDWKTLFKWAYLNREGVTKTATYHDLLELFSAAADTGGVFHFVDFKGEVNGIVLANVNHNCKLVEVSYCRLAGKGLLKQAFAYFHKTFPGYSLIATRHGKKVTYF